MPVRLKICCIRTVGEAQLAIRAGADAVGLVAAMPSGPGPIPDERIRTIARTVPPPIATFLLTSQTTPEAVVDHVSYTRVNTVQLVDDQIAPTVYEALRDRFPHLRIVQVIHVGGPDSVDRALRAAPAVDALLLDSGRPSAAIRELGGTGRVHDWQISRQIVEHAPVPVFLAGGLNPENVVDAITAVRPFGIDVCSGVRTDGVLDPEKLARMVAVVRGYEA